MPNEQLIQLRNGRTITDPKEINLYNRAKYENRVRFEDKVFLEMLRDAKRDQFKDNPTALQEHICERFEISKGYYFAICNTKTMAISPANRAQLETMLMTHLGQVMTDHQNIRSFTIKEAWEAASSEDDKIIVETNITNGVAANGAEVTNVTEKYEPKNEAAYKWFGRTVVNHKILYDTLKPFISKEFVSRMDAPAMESTEDIMSELKALDNELKKRQEVA